MKAQIAYEFIIVMFVLTLLFTVWFVISASVQEDLSDQNQGRAVQDFSLHLQDQLYTTLMMPEGFTRTITLPQSIAGAQYSMSCVRSHSAINITYILVNTSKHYFDVMGPPMNCSNDPENPTLLSKTLLLEVQLAKLEVR